MKSILLIEQIDGLLLDEKQYALNYLSFVKEIRLKIPELCSQINNRSV